MVVFDADVFTLVLNDRAKAPLDPSTDKPVESAKERVDYLIETLNGSGTQIVIPTPVLSEVLVEAGVTGLLYVEKLEKAAVFRIDAFDKIAAIELAEINRKAIATGNKKEGSTEPWQKIKVDRQIVAICKVCGATALYTCDKTLTSFARKAGIHVVHLADLPLPEKTAQMTLDLNVVAAEQPNDEADEAAAAAAAEEIDEQEPDRTIP